MSEEVSIERPDPTNSSVQKTEVYAPFNEIECPHCGHTRYNRILIQAQVTMLEVMCWECDEAIKVTIKVNKE